jgi:hypothetical protein
MDAQFGTLLTGNLKENTLTIEIDEDVVLRAGNYAVIRIDNINDQQKLEEFLKENQ